MGGWALGEELTNATLRYGFRLFEAGVVATVVVAAALFATTVSHRVRLERTAADPRWAPPATAPLEEQPV